MSSRAKSSESNKSTQIDRKITTGDDALIFAEGATVDFLSDDVFEDAINFVAQASGDDKELREKLTSGVLNFAQAQTTGLISGLDSILEFAGTQVNQGFQGIQNAQGEAFRQNAINLESQKSEDSQSLKQLLYAGVAVSAVIGAVFIIKGK